MHRRRSAVLRGSGSSTLRPAGRLHMTWPGRLDRRVSLGSGIAEARLRAITLAGRRAFRTAATRKRRRGIPDRVRRRSHARRDGARHVNGGAGSSPHGVGWRRNAAGLTPRRAPFGVAAGGWTGAARLRLRFVPAHVERAGTA
jgi:hypothetical protein